MRHFRPITVLVAIAALAAACSAPAASSSAQTSQAAQASQGANASQPAASSSGSGGGVNGTLTFEISGGYTRSGDLPWVPLASTFTNGAWYLTFGDSNGANEVVIINGTAGSFVVAYGNSDIAITGGVDPACSFTFSRQDASGAAGSFDCHGLPGIKTDGTSVQVDFKGSFDGHK
ncbi:MAG: hypothetical protein M3R32_06715 [Chloroflexota bacterium]|nr:hypothetical protein [Chloroflexota bacterium]